jgi:hypothetical protein
MDERFRRAEIDRLGEAMRARDLMDEEVDLYNAYRDSFLPALGSVLAALKDAGAPPATERQKTIWATVAKLRRSTARLSQVQDIAGCRVIVPLKNDQDALVALLSTAHPDWRLFDRCRRPSHGSTRARRDAEIAAIREGRKQEIVILEAESLDALKRTHGS